MLFQKLRENWADIERIGLEAEERGKVLGLKPSWADEEQAAADRKALQKADESTGALRKTAN